MLSAIRVKGDDIINNEQIIKEIAEKNGIEDELHTLNGWIKRIGLCHVKNGEEPVEAFLWHKRKNSNNEFEFYKTKSFLYTKKQIEKF